MLVREYLWECFRCIGGHQVEKRENGVINNFKRFTLGIFKVFHINSCLVVIDFISYFYFLVNYDISLMQNLVNLGYQILNKQYQSVTVSFGSSLRKFYLRGLGFKWDHCDSSSLSGEDCLVIFSSYKCKKRCQEFFEEFMWRNSMGISIFLCDNYKLDMC